MKMEKTNGTLPTAHVKKVKVKTKRNKEDDIHSTKSRSQPNLLRHTSSNPVGFVNLIHADSRYMFEKGPASSRLQTTFNRENGLPTVVNEASKLRQALPTLPPRVLLGLVIKFDGNCREVYDYLQRREWAFVTEIKKHLTNSPDFHFTTKYYHGLLQDGIDSPIFSRCKPGHFATFYKATPNGFQSVFCYCTTDSWVEKNVTSPVVPPQLLSAFSLHHPIMRCNSSTDVLLVPGLSALQKSQ